MATSATIALRCAALDNHRRNKRRAHEQPQLNISISNNNHICNNNSLEDAKMRTHLCATRSENNKRTLTVTMEARCSDRCNDAPTTS